MILKVHIFMKNEYRFFSIFKKKTQSKTLCEIQLNEMLLFFLFYKVLLTFLHVTVLLLVLKKSTVNYSCILNRIAKHKQVKSDLIFFLFLNNQNNLAFCFKGEGNFRYVVK